MSGNIINVDVELVRIPRHESMTIVIEKDYIIVRGGTGKREGIDLKIRAPINVRVETGG